MKVVRAARRGDVEQIAEIAAGYSLETLPPEAVRPGGFLVSAFDPSEYEGFVVRADHFYVLEEHGVVDGFVLAYSRERIRPDEWLNTQLSEARAEPFVLIKQICVRPCSVSIGVARFLYAHLFARTRGVALLAAIVLEPPNPRSVRFHERLGFEKVIELTPPDAKPRGVWRRPVLLSEPVRDRE